MNYTKMLIAFVAVVIAAMAYEFLVYGMLLKNLHQPHYGSLLVPEAEVNQGAMLGTIVIGAAVSTFFYVLFSQGRGSSLATGAMFGALLGVVASLVPQATLGAVLKGWPFFPHWALAGFAEHLLIGIVLGLAYRE